MKCWKCGNELVTGDPPNAGLCRRCVEALLPPAQADHAAGAAVALGTAVKVAKGMRYSREAWLALCADAWDIVDEGGPAK